MKQLVPVLAITMLAVINQALGQKQGQERLDSLVIELVKLAEDTNKVKLLNDISFIYYSLNPDEGIKVGKQALALAENLQWQRGIGAANQRIGINYAFGKGDFLNGQEYLLKGLKIAEALQDSSGVAAGYVNLGFVYSSQPNYPKALESYSKSLQLYTLLGNKKGIGANLFNMGIAYMNQGDNAKALEYYSKALKLYETLGNQLEITRALGAIGVAYENKKDHLKAVEYYFASLKIAKQLGDKHFIGQNLGNIGGSYYMMADSSKEQLNKLFGGNRFVALKAAKVYTDSAIVIDKEIGDLERLNVFYRTSSFINQNLGNYKEALESYIQHATTRDSLFSMEKDKKLTQNAMQYEFDKKEAADRAEQEKKDIFQRIIRNAIIAGLAIALIFLVIVYRQRNKIAKEEKRSAELLLNILPAETAMELKQTGVAKARVFDEVTVLFTDFKNFTAMSEMLSAQELVDEIHYSYSAFDEIIARHGVEKIKTIGDSYMCAGGLPVANKTNAEDIIRVAIEIKNFMLSERQKREASGRPFFEIRIGCNTGPVVAGIVGIKKFAYDIWGDAVNIASRMESTCEPGKINISGSTYELVKEKFTCTYRGKLNAKNKGMIDMYFVEAQ